VYFKFGGNYMKSMIFSTVMALALFVGVTQVDAARIHDAAIEGDLAAVEQQLRNGVDVNLVSEYGCTALIWAAWNGRIEIVNALLAHGADVNLANTYGYTALMYAAKNGHAPVVEALLPHLQVDDVLATNKDGQTALDLAQTDEIKQLIQTHIENKEFEQRGMKTKSARNVA
jgi:ankyrin repeat protein